MICILSDNQCCRKVKERLEEQIVEFSTRINFVSFSHGCIFMGSQFWAFGVAVSMFITGSIDEGQG